jgi:hypothetical protein
MKTLFLHHFEEYWSVGLAKFGTTFDEELLKVMDYLHHENIDKIIITRFEHDNFGIEHEPLLALCHEKGIIAFCHEYGYAWERFPYGEEDETPYKDQDLNKTWCQGQRDHHTENDVLEIHEWMHDLKNDQISLGGAFEDECISDIKAVFEALNIKYECVDGLIVGDCKSYQFKSHSPNDLECHISNFLYDVQNRFEEKCNDLNIPEEFDILENYDADFLKDLKQEIQTFYTKNYELAQRYHMDIYSNNEEIQCFIETECNTDYDLNEESDNYEEPENSIKFKNTNKKSTHKLSLS